MATSQATAKLAESLEIPLVTLDEIETIDIDFDGADEVDPRLDLIKGRGRTWFAKKLSRPHPVEWSFWSASSKRFVSTLGAQGVLPVEIVPFALAPVRRRVARLGYPASPREVRGKAFVTDNGNYVLDCRVPMLENPLEVEQAIRAIPGVVGTGLFLAGLANTVLIQSGDNVEVRHRERGASPPRPPRPS